MPHVVFELSFIQVDRIHPQNPESVTLVISKVPSIHLPVIVPIPTSVKLVFLPDSVIHPPIRPAHLPIPVYPAIPELPFIYSAVIELHSPLAVSPSPIIVAFIGGPI